MTRSQKGLAGFFAFAGTMHFVAPRSYEAMMPPALPRHREAVIVSGLAEVAGGAPAAAATGDALGLARHARLTAIINARFCL